METIARNIQCLLGAIFLIVAATDVKADNTRSKRLVLIEEFTNTGCAPCAEFAPYLDEILRERMDDVVAIKYHYNYPSRQDPYYLNEPVDMYTRGLFYDVEGVPTVVYNGEKKSNNHNAINGFIDQAMAEEKLIDLNVNASLTNHLLKVNTDISPVKDVKSDNLRAFVAVVEEWKVFDSAFPNGEKEFYYVLQKMLPDANGHPLGTELSFGRTYSFDTSWQVAHFYDETQLGIVVFVQDMSSKKVLETVYVPYPTGSSDAARVIGVDDTPDRICTPDFTSEVIIRCTGRNGLRSANVNVGINGSVQSTPWTGSMAYLERDTVETPHFTDFSFSATGNENDVEVWLSDINGTAEESARWKVRLNNSPTAKNAVRLSIMTDNKPEEITWKLLNSSGDIIDYGGPYQEARQKEAKTFSLDKDDCYTIEFHDAGGDGISGVNGSGYYKLDQLTSDGKSKMLVQSTYYGSVHDAHFRLTEAVPVSSVDDIAADQNASASVYDTEGRRIAATKVSNLTNLMKSRNLKGAYIIRIKEKGEDISRKVIFD